jgi:hypothetical protein
MWAKFTLRGQSSPLWSKFSPRGYIKSGLWNCLHFELFQKYNNLLVMLKETLQDALNGIDGKNLVS